MSRGEEFPTSSGFVESEIRLNSGPLDSGEDYKGKYSGGFAVASCYDNSGEKGLYSAPYFAAKEFPYGDKGDNSFEYKRRAGLPLEQDGQTILYSDK